MPKLAIYVPKKDMRQIERWRKKINFSKVFMKALLAEIHERERYARSGKNRDQTVSAAEFYKQELMAEGADVLVDHGYSLGYQHVLNCRLSTQAIRGIVRIESAESFRDQDASFIAESIGTHMDDVDKFAAQNGFDQASKPTWRHAVYRGFLKGVGEAWQRVCEQMNTV